MQIVIQRIETSLYLQEGEQWTPDWSKALNFTHVASATHFCQAVRLHGVRLVMQFESCADPGFVVLEL